MFLGVTCILYCPQVPGAILYVPYAGNMEAMSEALGQPPGVNSPDVNTQIRTSAEWIILTF